jgi:hypothetical protein
MPLDKRGRELHRGDEVSVRMRVMDVVAGSERLNVLLNFDGQVPGLPEEWRLQVPSDRVELESSTHQPIRSTEENLPAAASAGNPQA